MSSDPSPRPAGSGGCAWPLALAAVLIAALVVGGLLYVFRSLRQLPGDAADATRGLIEQVQSVAAAFRRGDFETDFVRYATTVTGTSYFQFATLEQLEEFVRTDRVSILWGQLDLPDVVVSATAPVVYTAYVDLDGPWRFRLEGRTLEVLAPGIQFNKPAIDATEIRYRVRAGSLLRDEVAALRKLKAGLTEMSIDRARAHLPLVRETGRRQIGDFVRNWLAQSFSDGADLEVRVRFADEAQEPEPPLRGLTAEPAERAQ